MGLHYPVLANREQIDAHSNYVVLHNGYECGCIGKRQMMVIIILVDEVHMNGCIWWYWMVLDGIK